MDEILQWRDKRLCLSFVKSGADVTGWGWQGIIRAHNSSLSQDTWTVGEPPYHLATDCGLQRIHQLCRDSDEVVVVGLDPVVPFQVRHGPPLGFYQLLVELLQHV